MKSLLNKGEIDYNDLVRKYTQELHANEIVLLSYYIAAINIEAVFDDINCDDQEYIPFEGIVLTDTFESTEIEDTLDDAFFGPNDQRLKRQKEKPITVIIGNPPYSVGQSSANDNNQNISYPNLDKRLENTYVTKSKSSLNKSAYDSYIKSIRWASDRLQGKGIIGFVTNGSYLDSNSTDGMRACLYKEFNYLYIFNLRGNALGLGENRKKEGGNIFGSGTRTTAAISILVKDGSENHNIYYHDIGDYLSQKEKLNIIYELKDISNIQWNTIVPDRNNDWINQRDLSYEKYDNVVKDVFNNNAVGISTNRDAWVIGFSKDVVLLNSKRLVSNYNSELIRLSNDNEYKKNLNRDSNFIKWSEKLEKNFDSKKILSFDDRYLSTILYRPFTKKWIYYQNDLVDRPGQYYRKFGKENLVLMTTGRGASRPFSALVSRNLPSLDLQEKGQGFMRYDNEIGKDQLFQFQDNMNTAFAEKLGLSLDDTFAYVYGLLNSKEYQQKYANDLKKDLARIPIVKHKEKYVEVGKALIELHINYESVPVYEDVQIRMPDKAIYKVQKMKFAKKHDINGKSVDDKSTIIYNNDIMISNIPEQAYEYIVNGRTAIEWIMEQYQIKTDKASGIVDDPNEYSNDEKYIFNLLLRIINVSIQTIDLVQSLPKFEIDE